MTTHLIDPAAPSSGRCREAVQGDKFKRWRREVDCKLCLMVTAPRPLDAPLKNGSLALAFLTKDGVRLPIRMTALERWFLANMNLGQLLVDELRLEAKTCLINGCLGCKSSIPDPIVLHDRVNDRMVYACPTCSSDELRGIWEGEA